MSGTRSPGCCRRQTRLSSGSAAGCARTDRPVTAPSTRPPLGAGGGRGDPDLHGAAVPVVPLEVGDGRGGDLITAGVPAGLRLIGYGVVRQPGLLRRGPAHRTRPDENGVADTGD